MKNWYKYLYKYTLFFILDQIYLANSGFMSNDPNKSTHFSNSSSLIEYIVELNFIEVTDAGPNICNASQLI